MDGELKTERCLRRARGLAGELIDKLIAPIAAMAPNPFAPYLVVLTKLAEPVPQGCILSAGQPMRTS